MINRSHASRERHQTALRLAASEGVVIEGPDGVEALAAETLEKVAEAAGAALAKPRKPKAANKGKKAKPVKELPGERLELVLLDAGG